MSIEHITEPARKTAVVAETHVAVVGAGPAGIAAAVAAARTGAATLLIDKHAFLGGMMTAGGVRNIRTFNDEQHQVVGGVGAELVERIRAGGGTEHTPTSYTCVRHDPEITKYVAQEMVLEAGVRVLLHSYLVGAVVECEVLKGVIVENKSGRGAIKAQVVVDATGDGDVIWQSGAQFEKDPDSLQPMTMTFVMGGVKCWPETKPPEVKAAIERAVRDGTCPTLRGGGALFPMWRRGEVYANATRVPGDCTDAQALTEAELEGRRQVMNLFQWYRRNAPGYEEAYLLKTGPQIGLRESRRLVGLYTLRRQDVLEYREFDDNVARGSYRIDIHYQGKGGENVYLDKGRSYGIPYRCLVPKRTDGLLASGRCISASHDALGSVRVMAICMATGHAAGVAAGLAAAAGAQPRGLAVKDIQQTLRQQGAILKPETDA